MNILRRLAMSFLIWSVMTLWAFSQLAFGSKEDAAQEIEDPTSSSSSSNASEAATDVAFDPLLGRCTRSDEAFDPRSDGASLDVLRTTPLSSPSRRTPCSCESFKKPEAKFGLVAESEVRG